MTSTLLHDVLAALDRVEAGQAHPSDQRLAQAMLSGQELTHAALQDVITSLPPEGIAATKLKLDHRIHDLEHQLPWLDELKGVYIGGGLAALTQIGCLPVGHLGHLPVLVWVGMNLPIPLAMAVLGWGWWNDRCTRPIRDELRQLYDRQDDLSASDDKTRPSGSAAFA